MKCGSYRNYLALEVVNIFLIYLRFEFLYKFLLHIALLFRFTFRLLFRFTLHSILVQSLEERRVK